MNGMEYLIDILEGVDAYLDDPLKAEVNARDYVVGKSGNSAKCELHMRVKRALAAYKKGEIE
jgi:hypothetical protein